MRISKMLVADIRGVYNSHFPFKIVSDQPYGQLNILFYLRIERMNRFEYIWKALRDTQKKKE